MKNQHLLQTLKEMQTQKENLYRAISAIDSAMSVIQGLLTQEHNVPIDNDLSKMTIPDAIKKILETEGREMRAKEIADKLLHSGIQTKASNFFNGVASILGKMAFNGVIVKTGRGLYKSA